MCICINGDVDGIHVSLDFIRESRKIRGKYKLTTALSVICLSAEAEGSGLYHSDPWIHSILSQHIFGLDVQSVKL